MKNLLLTLMFSINFMAQNNESLAQFAIWKPKEGQLQNFENGYKKHLNWHKENGDKWSWYGWFIISGERYGQFVDATFGHHWSDFDNAVKPAEDMSDNRLHVFPFGDVQTVFKVKHYSQLSTDDKFQNKLKIIRLVTIHFNNEEYTLKLIEKIKNFYISKGIESFQTYQLVDGGYTNQIILMIGCSNWENFGLSENINEKISELEKDLKTKTISSIQSESLIYREDMSFFPQ